MLNNIAYKVKRASVENFFPTTYYRKHHTLDILYIFS